MMRFMMLMIPKGYEKAAPGTMPDAKAVAAMIEVQRIPAEGRGPAHTRWLAPALNGRSCLVLRRKAQGDRRTLHRDEGSTRRLLDD